MGGRVFLAGVVLLLGLRQTQAQDALLRDSVTRAAAIARTIKEYRRYVAEAAPLYSGPQYTPYTQLVEKGQPFFLNTSFHPGSILFDHILYDRVQLKLDELTNRLIIADAEGHSEICPDPEKIESFRILEHFFTSIKRETGTKNAPAPGYYEVLYDKMGMTALKKESKVLRQNLEGSVVSRYIVTTVDYYMKKDGAYHSINKKSQLVELLKDRKKEVQEYIAKKELDFEDDKDNAIKSTLEYYEQLFKP